MIARRILVRSGETNTDLGTAWLIAPEIACTAFHVVGSCTGRQWAHELDPNRTYWLEDKNGPLKLAAAAFDARADMALLSLGNTSTCEVLALSDSCRANVRWSASGFPGFLDGKPFTMQGDVAAVLDDETSRAVQLTIDQGSNVDWAGMSGSAVIDDGRVAGLLTSATHQAATAWASPVSLLHRLLALHQLLERMRHAVSRLLDEPGAWLARLVGADHARATEVLEDACREFPHVSVFAELAVELRGLSARQRFTGMPSTQVADLQRTYTVVAERDGGQRFRPNPAAEFQDIFLAASHFGGRKDELGKLDRFATLEDNGYLFVTGTSGFGKTSLLASWIDTQLRRGEHVCFHFFSSRIPESLDPLFGLRKVCEQMLALHRVGGELPRERLQLQGLYAKLLGLPAPEGRPLLVVLDGIDEITEALRPGPALFPTRLGAGVHVIFSARATGRDWLGGLHVRLDEQHVVHLGRLTREDIKEVTERMTAPLTEPALDLLLAQTQGDPFYVEDVVRDIVAAGGSVEALRDLPPHHSTYLEQWWLEAVRRVADPGFIDLMGVLAVLRAPMAAGELSAIVSDAALKPAIVDRLLNEGERYVEVDAVHRYWLKHDRIREFVRAKIGPQEVSAYEGRLAEFALKSVRSAVAGSAADYGRNHAIAHLLGLDRLADALNVLNAEFMASKWRAEGSYRSLIADLDRVESWIIDHPENCESVSAAPAIATTRLAAQTLMARMHDTMYRALLRLGQRAVVDDLIGAVSMAAANARTFVALAEEALFMAAPGSVGERDRAFAADLLAHAIGLLPLMSDATLQLEVVAKVCELLSGPLADRPVTEMVRQTRTWIAGIDDPLLKACSFAHLACVVRARTQSIAEAALVDAETLASGLDPATRFSVNVRALKAHKRLRPGQSAALLLRDLHELPLEGDILGISLVSKTFQQLLADWSPEGEECDAIVAVAERVLRTLPFGTSLSTVIPLGSMLYRIGRRDLAWQFVDWTLGFADGNLLLRIVPMLVPDDRQKLLERTGSLYGRCKQGKANHSSGVAELLARIGCWPQCCDVLEIIDDEPFRDSASACIELAFAVGDGAWKDRILARILSLKSRDGTGPRLVAAAEGSSEFAATIALHCARARHPQARDFIRLASRQLSDIMPSQDADSLRQVVAIALAEAGHYESAERVARGCTSTAQKIEALSLSARASATAFEVQQRFARAIADVLADSTGTLGFVIHEACEAAGHFAPTNPVEAKLILDAAELLETVSSFDEPQRELDLLRVRTVLDPSIASATRARALALLKKEGIPYWIVPDVAQLALSAIAPAERAVVLAQLREFAEQPRPVEDRIGAMSAYAAVLCPTDTAESSRIFAAQVVALDSVAAEPSVPEDVQRDSLFSWEPLARLQPLEVDCLGRILSDVVCVAQCLPPQVLEELLRRAWNWIARSGAANLHRRECAYLFFQSLADLPKGDNAPTGPLAIEAAEDLAELFPQSVSDELLVDAACDFAESGSIGIAETIARGIRSTSSAARSASTRTLFTTLHAGPQLSPAERSLRNWEADRDAVAFVITRTRTGDSAQVLGRVLETLQGAGDLYSIVMQARLLVLPLTARCGALAAVAIVKYLDEFSERLKSANQMLGRA